MKTKYVTWPIFWKELFELLRAAILVAVGYMQGLENLSFFNSLELAALLALAFAATLKDWSAWIGKRIDEDNDK